MTTYRIVFVDDEKKNIEVFIQTIQVFLEKEGYNVEFKILSTAKEIEKINEISADVLLFDCNMITSDLDFGESSGLDYGLKLIKKFRENNRRTKVIFYSGEFKLQGSVCYGFLNEEILEIINDLHVYKMIPKNFNIVFEAIKEAIKDIDSITTSLEDLKEEYHSNGYFYINKKKIGLNDMLKELKNDTDIGRAFRRNIEKLVITYCMKFGGDED